MWILFGAEAPSAENPLFDTVELNQVCARFQGDIFEGDNFWRAPVQRALDAFCAKTQKSCIFCDYHGNIASLFVPLQGRTYMLEALRRAFSGVESDFLASLRCDAKTFFETARSHISQVLSTPKPVLDYIQDLLLLLKGLNVPMAMLSSTSIETMLANYDVLDSIERQFIDAGIPSCVQCFDPPPLTDSRIKKTRLGFFLEKSLSKGLGFEILMKEGGYTSAIVLEDSTTNIKSIQDVCQINKWDLLVIHNTESLRQKDMIMAELDPDAWKNLYRAHLTSCARHIDPIRLKCIQSLRDIEEQIKVKEQQAKNWHRPVLASFAAGFLGSQILNVSPKLIATLFVDVFGLNNVSGMLYGLFDGLSSFLMNTLQTFFSPPTKASAPECLETKQPLENVCLANHSLLRNKTETLYHIKPEIRFFREPSIRIIWRSSMRDLFIFDKLDLSLNLAYHTLKSPQDETRMLIPSRMLPSMFSGIMHPYLDIDLLYDSLDESINFGFNMGFMHDISCCCKFSLLSYNRMGLSLGSWYDAEQLVDNNLNICWANQSLLGTEDYQDDFPPLSGFSSRIEHGFGGDFQRNVFIYSLMLSSDYDDILIGDFNVDRSYGLVEIPDASSWRFISGHDTDASNLNICWANRSLLGTEYYQDEFGPLSGFNSRVKHELCSDGSFNHDGIWGLDFNADGYNDIIIGCPQGSDSEAFDNDGNVISLYGIGALRIPNTEAFYKGSVENSLAAYEKPSIYDSIYENLSLKDALGFGLLTVGCGGFMFSKMFESYHANGLKKLYQTQDDLKKALQDRENFLSSSF